MAPTITIEQCIANCLRCYKVCLDTLHHCLQQGGNHAQPNHIFMLQDCAQICLMTADFLIRKSPNHAPLCEVCEYICNECADDCASAKWKEDAQMAACAQMCRDCANLCKEMSEEG